LGQTAIRDGWQVFRFTAPQSAWWVGFNQLQLLFSSTVSPHDAGAGDDRRQLALGLSNVEVMQQD